MGGMIHLAPGATTFHAGRACSWIDANPFHLSEVDHQTIVAGTQSGTVMPATPDCQRQLVLTSKVDCSDHVGDIFALGNQRGVFVDHAVVDGSRLLVASIAGPKQCTC